MIEGMIYYTEKIIIVDIPAYLDEKHIKYSINIERQDSVTGVLTSKRTINSMGLSEKHGKVTLTLLIQDVEIKKINLSIFDRVTSKNVSLKSTISETCMDPDNVCLLELKLNIYLIDKKSNKANLLSLKEIEDIAMKNNLTLGHFIKRRSGGIATTAVETLSKINNTELVTNKYIKYALMYFKNKCSDGSGNFSRLIYRDLMKAVFENFLKGVSEPGEVIDEIGSIFGAKVNDSYMRAELRAFYHIYEALVPELPSSPGYDKIQHFTYCVNQQYKSSVLMTDAAQYIAEAYDLIKGGSLDDTLSDMEANNLGQVYGKELYERYHPSPPTK